MSEKAITVYDIAREAGVSPATVSRVLTNNARVSEEKRVRIEEIIKKYDFEPNSVLLPCTLDSLYSSQNLNRLIVYVPRYNRR